jgi:hypothetical protein
MPVTPTSFARRSTEASASPYAEGPRQRPVAQGRRCSARVSVRTSRCHAAAPDASAPGTLTVGVATAPVAAVARPSGLPHLPSQRGLTSSPRGLLRLMAG